MKLKKEDATKIRKPVLKKVAKSKRKIATPKAGASLGKAVQNVQQIFKKKAEAKDHQEDTKKKAKVTMASSKLPLKLPLKSPLKPLKEEEPKNTGIIYVGHIPHGFYEEQMKDYFQQFGKVKQVRVARSKNTGKSRGYGYVEFFHTEVAKIAAETMNNYLMCGRLLKATYIPPEKQHSCYFSGVNWSETRYPKLKNRLESNLYINSSQSTEDHKRYVKNSLKKLRELESKLQNKGINIKFRPIDIL